jgi:hypothetical protein
MMRKYHVRFLEEGGEVTLLPYSARRKKHRKNYLRIVWEKMSVPPPESIYKPQGNYREQLAAIV